MLHAWDSSIQLVQIKTTRFVPTPCDISRFAMANAVFDGTFGEWILDPWYPGKVEKERPPLPATMVADIAVQRLQEQLDTERMRAEMAGYREARSARKSAREAAAMAIRDIQYRFPVTQVYRDPNSGRRWWDCDGDDWFFEDMPGAWSVWKAPITGRVWWSHPDGRCFWA